MRSQDRPNSLPRAAGPENSTNAHSRRHQVAETRIDLLGPALPPAANIRPTQVPRALYRHMVSLPFCSRWLKWRSPSPVLLAGTVGE